MFYGHLRLRQTLPATLHVQPSPHDSAQHAAHSCQRNYTTHIHERTVRPTPSSPSITRARIDAHARVHSRRLAADRLPQRLLSGRATTWHAPTPCLSSVCTGNALAAASQPVAHHFARNLMYDDGTGERTPFMNVVSNGGSEPIIPFGMESEGWCRGCILYIGCRAV